MLMILRKNIFVGGSFILLGGFSQCLAQSSQFQMGVISAFQKNAWRDYKQDVDVMPIVNYEGKHLYVRGNRIGGHIWKNDTITINAIAHYIPLSFKPKNSRVTELKKVDKRHSMLTSGVAVTYGRESGYLSSRFYTDITNKSNAVLGEIAYGHFVKFRDITVRSELEIIWRNDKFNQYYYGLSEQESQRSGVNTYKPKQSLSPKISISTHYSFVPSYEIFMLSYCSYLGSQIKNSPMTDKAYNWGVGAGVTYIF